MNKFTLTLLVVLNLQACASKQQLKLDQHHSAPLLAKNELASAHKANDQEPLMSQELPGLEISLLAAAQEKMRQARAAKIHWIAPKTLKSAQKQLLLAENFMNADRQDLAKSNAYARQALYLTQKSIEISEQIKDFKRHDFTHEDLMLWHQAQLNNLVAGTEISLEFDQGSETVVRSANKRLITALDSQVAINDASRYKLSKIEQIKALVEQRQKVDRENLDYALTVFDANEAEVLSQAGEVLVRAHGFYFAPGKSNIDSRNFELLQKLRDVLGRYPNANIEITGHTDATGSSEINKMISKKRADAVKNFLIEIGRIEESRLISDGWGAERPVATNASIAGRGQNRRVEFLIKPGVKQ